MSSDFRPSYRFARGRGVAVQRLTEAGAELAVREPVDMGALQEVIRQVGQPREIKQMDADAYERLLTELYEVGDDVAQQVVDDLGDDLDLAALADDLPKSSDLLEAEDDAPIIRLINGILTQALKANASDIHFEPFESRLAVRFRVDGVLHEVMSPARNLSSLIISRLKVMAQLDIAEKRLPQDGRIGLRVAGRTVDVRVSTLPSSHGERVVLRLLDQQAGRLTLTELGMSEQARETMQQLLSRPHGIVLVTGPTGSGKSTSLYASIMQLNDRTRNIMTVEDPIEYDLDGVGQTQVNAKVDLTFARGLRAILRQDPDVVMVGEIRDTETAKMAVQASLTGHLVLTTLHTNTAVGAITRLVDMGIEPFLLASSLVGVVAQRLVRVIDPEQCEVISTDGSLLGLSSKDKVQAYRPRQDLIAGQTGYKGRTGIYEVVKIDSALRDAIHRQESEQMLEQLARQVTPSILDDGWRKVVDGVTSIEEVLRVTQSA
jgi:general secretion pathway protein E